MYRFIFSYLLVLVLLSGCETEVDYLASGINSGTQETSDNTSSSQLVGKISLTSSQDGTTGAESFSDVQIEVSGKDAGLVTFNSSANGEISLYVADGDMPADLVNNPLEFEVLVKSNQSDGGDIVSTGRSFVYQGNKIEQTVGIVRRSKVTSLNGVGGKTINLSISEDGSLASQQVVSVSTLGGANSKATSITLPSGVQFQDENGNILSGSEVSVKAVVFDAEERSATSFFPGGLSPNQISMLDGNTTSGDFVSAGFIALDMFVGGSEVKKFSDPIEIEMQLSSNLGLSVGAEVPYWSFDDATGIWKEEGSATVKERNGNLYATMEVSHLSYWNFDFIAGGRCSTVNRSIPVTLGNIESGDYRRLDIYALLRPSSSSSIIEYNMSPVVLPINIDLNDATMKFKNIPESMSFDITFYSDPTEAYKYQNGYINSVPEHLGVEIKDFNPCTASSLDASELKLDETTLSNCPITKKLQMPIKLPDLEQDNGSFYMAFDVKLTPTGSNPTNWSVGNAYIERYSGKNILSDSITLYISKKGMHDIWVFPHSWSPDFDALQHSFKLENPVDICDEKTIIDLTNYKDQIKEKTLQTCDNNSGNFSINTAGSNKYALLLPIGSTINDISDRHSSTLIAPSQSSSSLHVVVSGGYNILFYGQEAKDELFSYLRGGPFPGEQYLSYDYYKSTGTSIDFCSFSEGTTPVLSDYYLP